MGRSIVRYQDGEEIRWGELLGKLPFAPDDALEIANLETAATTTSQVLEALGRGTAASERITRVQASKLLSPITSDATILAQGLNYQAHAAEAQHSKRKTNLIFSKASSSLSGPYEDIVRPAEVELLDYEAEFGIVLRRNLTAGDEFSAENIGEIVAGVVLCNDVSARDTMFGASFMQWFRGKGYRTFCPAGPVLLYLECHEVTQALRSIGISLAVNGEERQRGLSDQLIWSPAETLTYIASTMDMHCGDLLLTGTPGGVTAPATAAMVDILKVHLLEDEIRRDALRVEMVKSRPFLKPGDLVTATMTCAGLALGGQACRVAEAA